jgi:hypothetical protein
MTAIYVLIAFAGGVVMGAVIVLIATRRHTVDRQILDQVQRIGAVFANTAQRGRAGEIVLENLLEASGMGRHRDFEVPALSPGGGRPDLVLTLPGRGRLFIDAKFPLDDFQRAGSATDKERRTALAAHGKAVASHVSQLAKRDYPAQLPDAMDFLVCYVPSEELLAAAYEARPTPLYDAAHDGVLIAGPATLLSNLVGHRVRPAARRSRPARAGDRRIGRRTSPPPRHPGPRTCRSSAALPDHHRRRQVQRSARLPGGQGIASGAAAGEPRDLRTGNTTARAHATRCAHLASRRRMLPAGR